MRTHLITEYKDIVMLGKVFAKGGISCLYGESGLGKTISTIKALNEEDIVPILLDFDNNNSPEQNGCNYEHIDGWKFMESFKDPEIATTIPRDVVIVIDTWAMFANYIDTLEDLRQDNTIIIIGHVLDIATKQDIPDFPTEFINHCQAKLFMSYDKGSSVKGKIRMPGPVLEVKKLRGYKGDKYIRNWMRN